MRGIFGVAGLLAVVLIVGLLAKKQLNAGTAPRIGTGAGTEAVAPAAAPQQQVRQFEQAVQGAMQQARPMPDSDQ